MSALLFIIGLLVGGTLGFLVSALVSLTDQEDDDAEL